MKQATPIRRAAIDIGTNSVRLLVADVTAGADGGNHVTPVRRALAMPRLGRGVDREGRLSDAAMGATAAAIERFADDARQHGAASIDVVGTSALRDASNKEEFVSIVRRRVGLDVVVLTGREEAALGFLGAARGTSAAAAPSADGAARAREVIVVDVGGGSTELVRGTADGVMNTALSVDVGAVRMTESCVRSDPISASDWARLMAAVRDKLQPLWVALEASSAASDEVPDARSVDVPVDLIGVGGTATTLAAMHQQLRTYDPNLVHGYTLSRAGVADVIEQLKAAMVAERSTWPGIQPERADIILAGALIVHQTMVGVGAQQVTVSESDLLDGVLLHHS